MNYFFKEADGWHWGDPGDQQTWSPAFVNYPELLSAWCIDSRATSANNRRC
jgi:hypothetical protein